jgi:hypothetical protein
MSRPVITAQKTTANAAAARQIIARSWSTLPRNASGDSERAATAMEASAATSMPIRTPRKCHGKYCMQEIRHQL